MQRKYLDLLVVPDDAGQIRRYRVPQWPRALLFGALAIALAVVAGAGIAYLRLVALSRENSVLLAENDGLRQELVTMGGQISQLDGAVRAQIHLANDARVLAGLPPLSEEVALLGVGGLSASGGAAAGAGISAPVRQTVGVYRDRLDRLGHQLAFQEESFLEVKQAIAASKERLDHLPAVNPIVGPFRLSSGFGLRRDPFTGRSSMHDGLDLCAEKGTPFCATADGRVCYAGWNGGMGRVIKIDHGNGIVTLYGHADQVLVREGQSVARGEVIGKVGRSGRTTGYHLHYEIHKDGRPVNPRNYILQG